MMSFDVIYFTKSFYRYDIAEILLKVALNTITLTLTKFSYTFIFGVVSLH